jgi:hypothetical protein
MKTTIVVGFICLGAGVLLGRFTVGEPQSSYTDQWDRAFYMTCMNAGDGLASNAARCEDVMKKVRLARTAAR